jgi:transaldolase
MSNDNPVLALRSLGQSVWLDNLTRDMIHDGALERLIHEDGVSGITSNPATFHASLSSGAASYAVQLGQLVDQGLPAEAIAEALAIEDVRLASDLLRPTFDETRRRDGDVSIEVSPRLARDAQGTILEAERLWGRLDRENVMIKIPGTPEGLAAIESALASGVNVNITLLFTLGLYDRVVDAFMAALETRVDRKQPLDRIQSVASFFLSRIDTKVDEKLDLLGSAGGTDHRPRHLRGQAAIACAKEAYRRWKQSFSSDRWKRLEDLGARPQRLLWASTSTKDPSYPDTKYIDPLIGPHTISTMPEKTMDAFRRQGVARPTLEEGIDGARRVLADFAELGIDLDAVGEELIAEGIAKFAAPYRKTLQFIEEERTRVTAESAGLGVPADGAGG